ncbi:MAG: HAMP domain-containing histidine kinase [Eubacterium sp.]|nr:HAMP domain-containing histidine kinase [Eubacterium sp.]
MFRKIKIKFIGISALSMMIVLFIVLGLVNSVTYWNTLKDIYTTLDFVSKHEDSYVKEDEFEKIKDKRITFETQFEARYITFTLGNDGTVISINDAHIASIGDEDIESFYKKVFSNDRDHGIFLFDNSYYAFKKNRIADGNEKLTVMDCTRYIKSFNFIKKFSIYIGSLSMLLLLLLLSIFARRVVQPYIKNAEAQKQFITNASHELKTPLAVISANTEVIEMMSGKNEWTESNIKQVKRMSDLISQLVVLSKLEERENIVLTDVNMSEVLGKVVSDFATVAETQGKHLTANIEENVIVKADEKGVQELANILTDNAVKYCDDKGTISVSLRKKGKQACFVVANNYEDGEGIDYKRFFDRFYREDQSHSNEKKGYGIGLSMADSLVRMFKGKISVTYKKPMISFTVLLTGGSSEKDYK